MPDWSERVLFETPLLKAQTCSRCSNVPLKLHSSIAGVVQPLVHPQMIFSFRSRQLGEFERELFLAVEPWLNYGGQESIGAERADAYQLGMAERRY